MFNQQNNQQNNPLQAMLNQTFGSNPNFNRAMQMMEGKSTNDLRETVLNLAKSQGISMQQLEGIARKAGFTGHL